MSEGWRILLLFMLSGCDSGIYFRKAFQAVQYLQTHDLSKKAVSAVIVRRRPLSCLQMPMLLGIDDVAAAFSRK